MKKSIRINFLYNLAYQLLTFFLPLIVMPYISRVLGAHNIGIFSFSQAFANYFVLLSMLGVKNYGSRTIAKVANDEIKRSRSFIDLYATQLITGLLACVSYFVIIMARQPLDLKIYLLQLIYILSAVFDVTWFCNGVEEFRLVVVRNALIRFAETIAIFLLVKGTNDLTLYVLIVNISFILSQLLLWPYVIKNVRLSFPKIKGMINHFKNNLLLFVPILAISLYNIMDKIMLGLFSGKTEVGLYTYAENIATLPIVIIDTIGTVTLPRIAFLLKQGEQKRILQITDKSMKISMILACAMAFGLAAISRRFVPWYLGEHFQRCGLFVIFLFPVIIFRSFASVIRNQFLIPFEKDKTYTVSVAVGAIVNLIVNLLLIPCFAGVGAIIGTVLAEFAVCFFQTVVTRRYLPIRQYIGNAFIWCIAGLMMAIPVFLIGYIQWNTVVILIIQVVAGCGIYFAIFCGIIYLKKDECMKMELKSFLSID